jgi:hypothetical protein
VTTEESAAPEVRQKVFQWRDSPTLGVEHHPLDHRIGSDNNVEQDAVWPEALYSMLDSSWPFHLLTSSRRLFDLLTSALHGSIDGWDTSHA